MSVINLNDDNFDVNSTIVFNGGNAGTTDNVSVRAEKKASTDSPNSPDWKVFFKDSKGGEVNEGYYYLDPKHANFTKQLKYQGAALRHLVHAGFGAETVLPNFATTKDMLDKCMEKLNSIPEGMLFRVGVSYGTTRRPDNFLRVKSYPEFIEPMTVPAEESRIAFNDSYVMIRPVADNKEEPADTGFTVVSETVGPGEPKVEMGSFDTQEDPTPAGDKKPDDLPF